MGLDLLLFQADKDGNPEAIKESQRARFKSDAIVDEIQEDYKLWVKVSFDLDTTNRDINSTQKEIGKILKAKGDAKELLAKKADLEKRKTALQTEVSTQRAALERKANSVGNLVDKSVPISDNEDNNELLKTWNPNDTPPVERDNILSHHEVLFRIGGYEQEPRGVKVVGHRGYFLTNYGVRLNFALVQYGLDFLAGRDYTPIQTPFFMNKEVMAKTAQLEDFDEQLYKAANLLVMDGADEKYLIATSEQPISALHMDEWLAEDELPKRYAGYSTCFRREAGSHGKEAWGIFRVHQFEKVEQFLLTHPEKSWEAYDMMVKNSEEFMQSLGLPYRLVAIVSGALNDAAAKKIDLEAWFPFQKEYKELVSCSNCTDYQSRALEIRCGIKKQLDKTKRYVHCLNGTLCATTRTLCCILENYQTEDGVNVPEVLRPYLGGLKFIPYTRDLPKNTTSQKRGVPTKTKSAHEIAKGPVVVNDAVPAKELVEKAAELNLS